jgi:predicted membrane channel-forming protein YqfA (hemolysin III family)
MQKSAQSLADRRPYPIILQGISVSMGWALALSLERGLHVDDETILWIMAPSMAVFIIGVDHYAVKFSAKACWILGIGGWAMSFVAVCCYAYVLK